MSTKLCIFLSINKIILRVYIMYFEELSMQQLAFINIMKDRRRQKNCSIYKGTKERWQLNAMWMGPLKQGNAIKNNISTIDKIKILYK